jgi:hypothetical protein
MKLEELHPRRQIFIVTIMGSSNFTLLIGCAVSFEGYENVSLWYKPRYSRESILGFFLNKKAHAILYFRLPQVGLRLRI